MIQKKVNNQINLEERLDFRFKKKPLLIGGLAMEYYGLRKAGKDVDFVLSSSDHTRLKSKLDTEGMIYLKGRNTQGYKNIPEFVDLYGDLGILIYEFELWNCILKFDYSYLIRESIEEQYFKVISLKELLFIKALAIENEKYLKDVKLISAKIIKNQYS